MASAAIASSVLTIPAREELFIMVTVTGLSVADVPALRFNGDAANNYWSRYISSVAGGVVLVNNQNVSVPLARVAGVTFTQRRVAKVLMMNQATHPKVGTVDAQTGSGVAATAGGIEFGGFEWVNTAAQITSIEMRSAGGTATLSIGSGFTVLGRNL
jgi:hypothetical protein